MPSSGNTLVKAQPGHIADMIQSAIGSDPAATHDGFVTIMARSHAAIQQDIPAAFEMYTLLSHFLERLPMFSQVLEGSELALVPSIAVDEAAGKLVVLFNVPKGELDVVAHWIANEMRSDTVRRMGGVLALPFSIETHAGNRHLVPEWFAAFYVDGATEHCVPLLTLRSITQDERFGDWVTVALERMRVFGLSNSAASQAVQHETSR